MSTVNGLAMMQNHALMSQMPIRMRLLAPFQIWVKKRLTRPLKQQTMPGLHGERELPKRELSFLKSGLI